MHRALTVAVVLAVVAGSVPAAASLADGTPSDQEPGASFAGVVGVQGAEVDNEVANRSLDRQLRAAESNRSKAQVVASESQQLEQRLADLEAEKARLKQAYENGSISKGKYTAQLAVVAADLRALERRANRTAGVAERLPSEALREMGANASHVREIARDANRSGGGEVAEAARAVAGESVGNGLGNPPAHAGPPNGSETGPPENAGGPGNAATAGPPADGNGNANTSDATNRSTGPPADVGNQTPRDAGNGSDSGNATNGPDATNRSNAGNAGTNGAPDHAGNTTNRSDANRSDDARKNGNATTNTNNAAGNETTETDALGWSSGIWADNVQQIETVTDAPVLGRATLTLG